MPSRWYPLLLWTLVILLASSNLGNAQHTGGTLKSIVAALGLALSPQQFAWLHFAARKLAHLVAYAIEGAFAYHALGASAHRRFAKAMAIAVVVAAIDELHQSTNPTRTGSVGDVLIDAVGAMISIVVLRAASEGRNRRARSFQAP